MNPHNSADDNKKVFGAMAYLGPLVIVSYLTKKDDAFVKFHIKQGLVLFTIEIVLLVFRELMWSFWSFWEIYRLLHLAILVFIILGIVNVVQGKLKELPILGDFAKHFHI